MDILQIYNNSQIHKIISKDKSLGMLSHAYLIDCADSFLAHEYARLVAKEIYCEEESSPCCVCPSCMKVEHSNMVDLKVYPKDKNIVVDDVVEIVGDSLERPMDSKYKVYILKSFDEATTQAQNKILKTLEEPPANVIFILTCSSTSSVLQTILSRVKVVAEPSLPINIVTEYLKDQGVKDYTRVACVSGGNITTANKLANMGDVGKLISLAIDTLMGLKSSADILKYSSKIVSLKKDFAFFLDTLILLLRDAAVYSGKGDIVFKEYAQYIASINAGLGAKAILEIVSNLCLIYNKLEFNCNLVAIVDQMLLDILEVKFLCQK